MSEWTKDYAGRYISRRSGWIIERSENSKEWNVINPDTGRVFDTQKTLTAAKKWYSGIQGVCLRQNAKPKPDSIEDRQALNNLRDWISKDEGK